MLSFRSSWLFFVLTLTLNTHVCLPLGDDLIETIEVEEKIKEVSWEKLETLIENKKFEEALEQLRKYCQELNKNFDLEQEYTQKEQELLKTLSSKHANIINLIESVIIKHETRNYSSIFCKKFFLIIFTLCGVGIGCAMIGYMHPCIEFALNFLKKSFGHDMGSKLIFFVAIFYGALIAVCLSSPIALSLDYHIDAWSEEVTKAFENLSNDQKEILKSIDIRLQKLLEKNNDLREVIIKN